MKKKIDIFGLLGKAVKIMVFFVLLKETIEFALERAEVLGLKPPPENETTTS